ncbi:MAG: dTDP-4-dehydrorhamnose 3,5-epimerase family protein [Candidatus Omnitrophica bacterium]|nr:dTDP-4-dehydrorhamnose 3,5-epimerase family protein [Candidatus Omnitrophota bacterium]
MIEGVVVKDLKIFSDEKGKVMHMLRSDDDLFKEFGEVYFSTINSGAIKGWKNHSKMTQHYAVPKGNIQLVIYDDRTDSATKGEVQEVTLGLDNYRLVRIPRGVWYSFKAIGGEAAMIVNCTDLAYDPDEITDIDIFDNDIPYKWKDND